MNFTVSKRHVSKKLIALATASFFFINIFATEVFALAPQTGIENPATRCEYYIACLLNSGRLVFAEEAEAIKLLEEGNSARALLLSHGKILASKDLKNQPEKLYRTIVHEQIEAIMQIMARENRARYSSLMNLILSQDKVREAYYHLVPADQRQSLPDELLANDILSSAFELLISKRDRLIGAGDFTAAESAFLKAIEPVINANKHNCFTGVFWDPSVRELKIRVAMANGVRFTQAASRNGNDTDTGARPRTVSAAIGEPPPDRSAALSDQSFTEIRKYGNREQMIKALRDQGISFEERLFVRDAERDGVHIALFNYPSSIIGNADFFSHISRRLEDRAETGKVVFLLVEKEDLDFIDKKAVIRSGLVVQDNTLRLVRFTEPISAHCVIEPFEDSLTRDLEKAGVTVVPSAKTIALSGDRLAQHRLLEKYGVSLNETFAFIPYEYDIFAVKDRVDELFEELKGRGVKKVWLKVGRAPGNDDVVYVEDVDSPAGRDTMRRGSGNADRLDAIRRLIEQNKSPLMIERYIEPVAIELGTDYSIDERYKKSGLVSPRRLKNLRNDIKMIVSNAGNGGVRAHKLAVVSLSSCEHGKIKTVAHMRLENFLDDIRFDGGKKLTPAQQRRLRERMEGHARGAMRAVIGEGYDTDILAVDMAVSDERDESDPDGLPKCYVSRISTQFFFDRTFSLLYGKTPGSGGSEYWDGCFDYILYMARRNMRRLAAGAPAGSATLGTAVDEPLMTLSSEHGSIPVTRSNDRGAMYYWVRWLQRHSYTHAAKDTTIINFSAHADADVDGGKGSRNASWMRCLQKDRVSTGRRIWVRNKDILGLLQGERGSADPRDHEIACYGKENIFDSVKALTDSVSGPAIININYDFIAPFGGDITDRQIQERAGEIVDAVLLSGIRTIAVNVCYDAYDDNGRPRIIPKVRERISKALAAKFKDSNYILQGDVGRLFDIFRKDNVDSVTRGIGSVFNNWNGGNVALSPFVDYNVPLFWYLHERFGLRGFIQATYFSRIINTVFGNVPPDRRAFEKACRSLPVNHTKCNNFIDKFATFTARHAPSTGKSLLRVLKKSGYRPRDYVELLMASVYIVMKYKIFDKWDEPAERFIEEMQPFVERLIMKDILRNMKSIERRYGSLGSDEKCDILEALLYNRYRLEVKYLALFLNLQDAVFTKDALISDEFARDVYSRLRRAQRVGRMNFKHSLAPWQRRDDMVAEDFIPVFARKKTYAEHRSFGELERYGSMFGLTHLSAIVLGKQMLGVRLAEDFDALVAVCNKNIFFKQALFNITGFPTEISGEYVIDEGETNLYFPEWFCLLLALTKASAKAVTFNSKVIVSPHHEFICTVRQVLFEAEVIRRANKSVVAQLLKQCDDIYPDCLLRDLIALAGKLYGDGGRKRSHQEAVGEAIAFTKAHFPQFRHYQSDLYAEVTSALSLAGEMKKLPRVIERSIVGINAVVRRAEMVIQRFVKTNHYIPQGDELRDLAQEPFEAMRLSLAESFKEYRPDMLQFFFNTYLKYMGDLIEAHRLRSDGVSGFLEIGLRDFYALFLDWYDSSLFRFLEKLLEEFGDKPRNDRRTMIFLGRGAHDVYGAARQLARASGVKLPVMMEVVVSKGMLAYYGDGQDRDDDDADVPHKEEVIVKYLYDRGALDRPEIIFVDTGFRGEIPCTLAKIVNNQNIRRRFSAAYNVRVPVGGKYRCKLRVISHSRPTEYDAIDYSELRFDDIDDYFGADEAAFREEAGCLLDDGLEKELYNNVTLAQEADGKVNLIRTRTHRRGLLELTQELFEESVHHYVKHEAPRLAPRYLLGGLAAGFGVAAAPLAGHFGWYGIVYASLISACTAAAGWAWHECGHMVGGDFGRTNVKEMRAGPAASLIFLAASAVVFAIVTPSSGSVIPPVIAAAAAANAFFHIIADDGALFNRNTGDDPAVAAPAVAAGGAEGMPGGPEAAAAPEEGRSGGKQPTAARMTGGREGGAKEYTGAVDEAAVAGDEARRAVIMAEPPADPSIRRIEITVPADALPEERAFIESLGGLERAARQDYGVQAREARGRAAARDTAGASLILYADDMLEHALVVDLEHTVKNVFAKHDASGGGRIMLVFKNEANAMAIEKMIQRADPDSKTIKIALDDLRSGGNEAREADALLRMARAKGAKDTLCLIRGPAKQPEELAAFAKSSNLPIVIVGPEKGVYSFAQAIAMAIDAKVNNGATNGWLMMLPPVRVLTDEIKRQYQEYERSLLALVSA